MWLKNILPFSLPAFLPFIKQLSFFKASNKCPPFTCQSFDLSPSSSGLGCIDFLDWFLLSPWMPERLWKFLFMCEFFLRKLHFNKPPQRPQILQRRPFPPLLGTRVPSVRVCAPPNLRAPSVCPILYLLTAEPFLQGCLKTCLCHKPHLPLCPSTAPRKLGCMAVTCPPDFMMHVCSPWRNYRQVPSGRSSNISAHF